MKSYTAKVTFTLTVYVGVEGMDEAEARENAMSAVEDMPYEDMDCEVDVEVQENEEDGDDDDEEVERLAQYSETYRNGIAYVMENMDEDDKAIIHAECNKAYKQHLVPDDNIVDDSKITGLLEEYGENNDLPEGWYEEEFDASEILTMI